MPLTRFSPAKSLAALGILTISAGCSLPGNWSYAGLTYDISTNDFSGMPKTTVAQLPATGLAKFVGEYRNISTSNPLRTDKGQATLDVDFQNHTVVLGLTGDLNESASGVFLGAGFGSPVSSGFNFGGAFYGTTASVAAGFFYGAGGDPNSQGQFITKR